MTNSRDKGKRGEREWAKLLTDMGFPAHRGQQHRGGNDSPDVICDSMRGFYCEVKWRERLNLHGAMAQADKEAGKQVPYIAHKKNGMRWLVTMYGNDWIALHVQIAALKKANEYLMYEMSKD